MHLLYRLLRRPVFYRIFVWMLQHLPFALPARRLRQSERLLAFFHPRPSHPFHVLLVPRRAVGSFPELPPGDPFLPELAAAVQGLVAEYDLKAWRLVVNGGEYQEFPHLHFHLISDSFRSQGQPPTAAGIE